MTIDANDITALRQALEAGDLKHAQVEALVDRVEQQATEIADLDHRVTMALTWTRSYYKAKSKAEKALLESVRRVARDSAALARRWPKHELVKFVPAGQKPTKEQVKLARTVANGIATHILNQVKEE